MLFRYHADFYIFHSVGKFDKSIFDICELI